MGALLSHNLREGITMIGTLLILFVFVLLVVAGLTCDFTAQQMTDEVLERIIEEHDYNLLYLAVATDQGVDGMTFGFDMWWRLSEGRWTKGLQPHAPSLTDAGLLAFLKRYAKHHRYESARAVLRRLAVKMVHTNQGITLPPGESIKIPIQVEP